MPKDPETIKYPDSGLIVSQKKVVFMGPHTQIIHRYPKKETLGFQVIFLPGAISQLTNTSANTLTNMYMDAEDLFGNAIHDINEQLYYAKNYLEMISIVERFLVVLIKKASRRSIRLMK